ncbi:MAG: DNA repair protein RecO [Magnetococcales bacterium]|nr:DNA repair protein RecO [Magnetococcales bacterium]
MRITDQGLVLQRIAFRESSLVLKILTRTHGKHTFMARGVRSDHRDGRRGALAGFHTLEVEGSARGTTAMLTLRRAEITTARHHLPHRAPALGAAQILQETIIRLIPEADPCSDIFDLAVSCLDLLNAGGPPLLTLSHGLGRMIHLLGHGWRLDGCAGCGDLENVAFFSVKRQQMVCRRCGAPYADRLLPLTAPVLRAMNRLDWPPAYETMSLEEAEWFYRIVVNCLARITGGPLLTDGPFRAMMESKRRLKEQKGPEACP